MCNTTLLRCAAQTSLCERRLLRNATVLNGTIQTDMRETVTVQCDRLELHVSSQPEGETAKAQYKSLELHVLDQPERDGECAIRPH